MTDNERTLRIALTKIVERTSERLRTKADMVDALDAIDILASEALAETSS